MITKDRPYRVLFVCLGNICRSPTAEGLFQHQVNASGLSAYFEIDSAGTSAWHEGEPANSKSRMTAERYGVSLLSRSRPVRYDDFDYYDLILAMDTNNLRDLKELAPEVVHHDKIKLMRTYDPEGNGDVPDPYYDTLDGFDQVFHLLDRSCKTLLADLKPMVKLDL
jgi:protein-tyrosine phosphatase